MQIRARGSKRSPRGGRGTLSVVSGTVQVIEVEFGTERFEAVLNLADAVLGPETTH